MPVYNDTPQAQNPINQTQAPIQTNFQSIRALIDINHVDFADPVNFGKHTVVSLLAQAASPPMTGNPPANAFGATDVGFYNFVMPVGTGTGRNEVYVNKITMNPYAPFTIAPQQVPMTAFGFLRATSQQGWMMLPNGLIVKWGGIPAFAANTPTSFLIPSGTNETGPAITTLLTAAYIPYAPGGPYGNIVNDLGFIQPQSLQVGSSTGCPQGVRYIVLGSIT